MYSLVNNVCLRACVIARTRQLTIFVTVTREIGATVRVVLRLHLLILGIVEHVGVTQALAE